MGCQQGRQKKSARNRSPSAEQKNREKTLANYHKKSEGMYTCKLICMNVHIYFQFYNSFCKFIHLYAYIGLNKQSQDEQIHVDEDLSHDNLGHDNPGNNNLGHDNPGHNNLGHDNLGHEAI